MPHPLSLTAKPYGTRWRKQNGERKRSLPTALTLPCRTSFPCRRTGCGLFLGDRTKGLSYVRSRGTTARGGPVLRHADDHGPGGRAPGPSDQAVPGTLAGKGFPVCRPYGQTHHPTGDEDQDDRTGAGRHARKRAAERLGAGVGTVRNRVRAYREGGMAALRPENRDAGQADKPAMRRDRDAGDAEAPRRRVEEPELGERGDAGGGGGVRLFQGKVRVPQDHGRGRSDGACSRTTRVRLIRGRGHAGSRRPRRQDARQGRGDAAGGSASLGAFRPRLPLPVARMAGAHGPLRPDTVDGRQGPFPGRRRRRRVPRAHEDGIRPSRALGGAYPQRGARPGRRLHPLARPRAHQTVARLDESGTIPSEPGNGCVTISKKTSTAPSITKQRMQRRTRLNY